VSGGLDISADVGYVVQNELNGLNGINELQETTLDEKVYVNSYFENFKEQLTIECQPDIIKDDIIITSGGVSEVRNFFKDIFGIKQ